MTYHPLLAIGYSVFAMVFVVSSVPIATSSGPIGASIIVLADVIVAVGSLEYVRRYRREFRRRRLSE